jgi:hypothetical protein
MIWQMREAGLRGKIPQLCSCFGLSDDSIPDNREEAITWPIEFYLLQG